MSLLDKSRGFIKKRTVATQSYADQLAEAYRRRMQWEAAIGGQLFGAVPAGMSREFFCLDERTWIWHETWQGESGSTTVTTRYDVRRDGIFKTQSAQDGEVGQAQLVDGSEVRNLYRSMLAYRAKVLAPQGN